jgi:hypothetical protein
MKAAIPRYFHRASGRWHRTWSAEEAPLLTTTCGLAVEPVGVEWAEICDDGLPVLPRSNLCAGCFKFLFDVTDDCASDQGPGV